MPWHRLGVVLDERPDTLDDALEAAGVNLPDPQELLALETVADVEKLVAR